MAPPGTITCFLCGGTRIYPGPRFRKSAPSEDFQTFTITCRYEARLQNEHGAIFDLDSLISVGKTHFKHISRPFDQWILTFSLTGVSAQPNIFLPAHSGSHSSYAAPINWRGGRWGWGKNWGGHTDDADWRDALCQVPGPPSWSMPGWRRSWWRRRRSRRTWASTEAWSTLISQDISSMCRQELQATSPRMRVRMLVKESQTCMRWTRARGRW